MRGAWRLARARRRRVITRERREVAMRPVRVIPMMKGSGEEGRAMARLVLVGPLDTRPTVEEGMLVPAGLSG